MGKKEKPRIEKKQHIPLVVKQSIIYTSEKKKKGDPSGGKGKKKPQLIASQKPLQKKGGTTLVSLPSEPEGGIYRG